MRAVRDKLAAAMVRAVKRSQMPVAAAAVAVALLTLPSAWSAFTGPTANTSTVGAGTVTLTDNDSSDTLKLFNLTGLLPGDTSTSCIKVTYGGTLPALVDLFGTTSGTGLDAY